MTFKQIKDYDYFARGFHQIREVTTTSTNYSRKVEFEGRKIMFNEDGKQDFQILTLLNKVKKDVKHYVPQKAATPVNWAMLNNEIPTTPQEIVKIDLNSAYWTKALNMKLITEETNDYWFSLKGTPKEMKQKRLKALGSLATIKRIDIHSFGKITHSELDYSRKNRAIYFDICRKVGEDMSVIFHEVNGLAFYWDCFFVAKSEASTVVQRCIDLGYETTVEPSTVIAERGETGGIIKDITNDKSYFFR